MIDNINLKVNTAEWMINNMGRFSIGKHIDADSSCIYAYTDDPSEIEILKNKARKEHLETYSSISMEGITSLEKEGRSKQGLPLNMSEQPQGSPCLEDYFYASVSCLCKRGILRMEVLL